MGQNFDLRKAFIFKSKSGKEFPFVFLFFFPPSLPFCFHPFPSPFPPNLFGLRLTCTVHLSPFCEVITDQHWRLISSSWPRIKENPRVFVRLARGSRKWVEKLLNMTDFLFFFFHTRLSGVMRVERKPYHVQAICSLGNELDSRPRCRTKWRARVNSEEKWAGGVGGGGICSDA